MSSRLMELRAQSPDPYDCTAWTSVLPYIAPCVGVNCIAGSIACPLVICPGICVSDCPRGQRVDTQLTHPRVKPTTAEGGGECI